jgi:DNA polymerase-3 subunit alpha
MLKDFREIMTKSNRKMAFGAIEDFAGSMEIVVFPDMLEKSRESFVTDKVLCLRGKIDTSRSAPSLKVEEIADPEGLRDKSWREVHLKLKAGISSEDELYDLRDILFETPGPCTVYFHVPGPGGAGDGEALVRANPQITCSPSAETLDRLKETAGVLDAWAD